jgi:hypothetical protein
MRFSRCQASIRPTAAADRVSERTCTDTLGVREGIPMRRPELRAGAGKITSAERSHSRALTENSRACKKGAASNFNQTRRG